MIFHLRASAWFCLRHSPHPPSRPTEQRVSSHHCECASEAGHSANFLFLGTGIRYVKDICVAMLSTQYRQTTAQSSSIVESVSAASWQGVHIKGLTAVVVSCCSACNARTRLDLIKS